MLVFLSLIGFVLTWSTSILGATTGALQDKAGKEYLLKYGYIGSFAVGKTELQNSIIRFQHFANLPQTGDLDAVTLKQMTLPRCGLQDPKLSIKRGRRFVRQGTSWKKNLLSWRLEGRGRTLTRDTIRRVMYKAFTLWSDKTNMDFKETTGNNPDIWVKFVTYYHDDPYSFDGEGGTLAHAFYPHTNRGLSGDVHFDDAEDYTYQSPRGRNLLWVATHELGHSLGLEHSNVRDAVMYPWYTKYQPGFKLHSDDVLGIQTLYGGRVRTTRGTTTTRRTTTTIAPKPTRPIPSNRPCPISKITAVYYNTYARLTVMLTENNKMYFVKQQGGIRYGPVSVTNYLPKSRIPDPIDAAFNTNKVNNRDVTIFFAGKNYYIYQHFRFISGPHSIYGTSAKNPLNLKFPTWVSKIDAAMTWQRNRRTYFFAHGYYWRYNNDLKAFDRGYPRKITGAWKGVPKNIDAAYSLKENKKTFFISGNQYYLLNDNYVRVEKGYPENIGREWLNCGGTSSMGGSGSLSAGGLSANEERGRDP